jgi:hypothetical protein
MTGSSPISARQQTPNWAAAYFHKVSESVLATVENGEHCRRGFFEKSAFASRELGPRKLYLNLDRTLRNGDSLFALIWNPTNLSDLEHVSAIHGLRCQ